MMTARRWSWSAPATISDAEADPPFTSTTSGAPFQDVGRLRVELELGVFEPALGVHDGAFREEGVGYRYRRAQHATGIVSQIEDHASESARDFVLELPHCLAQALSGARLELGDAHIGVSVVEEPALDAGDADDVADDGDSSAGHPLPGAPRSG